MKKTFFLILLFVSITAFAQNQDAIKYFNQGSNAYNQQEYKTADSLFTLSAKLQANKDIYLKLASAKKMLGDSCGFCENLKEAVQYGDLKTYKLYSKYCITIDTIKYLNVKEKNVFYYCISSYESCSKNKTYNYYKKYKNNDSVISFSIYQNDSIKYEENEFLLPSFDIEKAYQIHVLSIRNQEMPTYLGGEAARMKFISDNIIYPIEAKEKNIQGTVYVTFIVEKDGKTTDVKILMGIGSGCNEECIRR